MVGILFHVLAFLLIACSGSIQQTVRHRPGAPEEPSWLYIQQATSGTLEPLATTTSAGPNEDAVYRLTLRGVGEYTLAFQNRPGRNVHKIKTREFMHSWDSAPDSYSSNPPNAALDVLAGPDDDGAVILVMITSAEYSTEKGGTLTYQVRPLKETTGAFTT